jgi:hypothetical protein
MQQLRGLSASGDNIWKIHAIDNIYALNLSSGQVTTRQVIIYQVITYLSSAKIHYAWHQTYA